MQHPEGRGGWATWRRLLSPRWLGLRNLLRGERRGLYIGLSVLGLVAWLALLVGMYVLVGQFWSVEGFGPLLARKLLEMLLASLFVMLCFSNVVSALSTYFLADDLELVLSLPVSRTTFHYARLAESLAQSSWMMAFFGMPVFLAYGARIGAGPAYYAAVLCAVPALLVVAGGVGTCLATVLVNVFPARRTRELMVLLGVLMLTALFLLFRSLRPERFVDASQFQDLAGYIRDLQVPAPVLFPPRWASEVMAATLLHAPFPWEAAGLLATGAAAMLAVTRWTVAWGFDGGWTRAQEARAARFHTSRAFERAVRVLPAAWRPMVAKDLRVFVRDPSQWSQGLLLVGICAIYLVSVRALPVDAFQGPVLAAVKQAIAFLNLGMGGFVMAAIAARFVFTAVSREGRSWWLVRSAPLPPEGVLHAKSVVGLLPMLAVGEVVVVGSGLMLDAPRELVALEAVFTVLLAVGIAGIAVAMGALWPDFRADTAAQAASSPAAVLFMVVALLGVGGVLVLVGLGLAVAGGYGGVAAGWAAVPLGLAAAGCLAAGVVPPRIAARRLWERGV
jgi:ABC-2 type transport system permease protein